MNGDSEAKRRRRRAFAALAAASILWGAGFLLAKIAMQEVAAGTTVFCRFAVGSILLLIPVIVRREWIRRSDFALVAGAGVLGVPATYLPQFMGLAQTDASTVALIVGILPALLALAGALFLHERPGTLTWGGIALSGLGMLLLAGPVHQHQWQGSLLVVCSLFPLVAWTILTKRLLRGYSPLGATAWVLSIGTVALVPCLIAAGTPLVAAMSAKAAAAIVASGLLCTTMSYLLWNWGLQHTPVSHAGVFTNIETIAGVLLAVAFLGEKLAWNAVIGGAMVVVAAIIVAGPDS